MFRSFTTFGGDILLKKNVVSTIFQHVTLATYWSVVDLRMKAQNVTIQTVTTGPYFPVVAREWNSKMGLFL